MSSFFLKKSQIFCTVVAHGVLASARGSAFEIAVETRQRIRQSLLPVPEIIITYAMQ
jgi:hypothetical protein